jgi:hypothetical protein
VIPPVAINVGGQQEVPQLTGITDGTPVVLLMRFVQGQIQWKSVYSDHVLQLPAASRYSMAQTAYPDLFVDAF